jgi:hypothetical protein
MNTTLRRPIQRYLEALELELKRYSGVSPEEALSDAREYLQNQQNSLLRAEPTLDDDALYAHFVQSFGPPEEVAAAYAETAGERAETSRGYAPGWRICCTTCGRSAPLSKYGVRIGAASVHKYTLGYCRGCRWIRWLRIIKDADSANLTQRLGFDSTPDEVRRTLHRPWLILATILAVVLLASLAPWLFVETAPGDPASQPAPTRTREFIRLVVGPDMITLEGEDVSWDQLRDRLSGMPHRERTVLEFAVTSDELPGREAAIAQALRLVTELGFEYFSDTGVRPLGAKGSASQEIALDQAAEAMAVGGAAVDPAHPGAMIVREWLSLVLAGKREEADKLTDFPRRADATHDVHNLKLLSGVKLEHQFTRKQAVLIASDRMRFDGKTGNLLFLVFHAPGNRFGWLIREADFIDAQELAERIAPFTAPVLLNQEVERTLGKDKNHVLDLESGRCLGLTQDWDRQMNDSLKWIAVRGLDVKLFANPNKAEEMIGLALLGNVVEVDREAWNADAEKLEELLQDQRAMNSTLTPDPEQLPATYAFRTHGHPANEPYVGVLQILGMDHAQHELRFRYRLVGESHPANR